MGRGFKDQLEYLINAYGFMWNLRWSHKMTKVAGEASAIDIPPSNCDSSNLFQVQFVQHSRQVR